MKKIWILFVLLLLCTGFLTACGIRDAAPTGLPGSDESLQEETIETVPAAMADVFDGIAAEPQYYQYGNMQKNVPSGNYMLYGNEVVFEIYDGQQFLLYAYDLTTGNVRFFCDREYCPHSGVSCNAIGRSFGNVEQYNDRLYCLSQQSSLMEYVDGKWIFKLADVSDFWHAYDTLFVITKDYSLQVYKDGQNTPQTIMDMYEGIWSVVYDQYLYQYHYSKNPSDCKVTRYNLWEGGQAETILTNALPMIDGTHIYYTDEENKHLYRCEIDGSNPELLFNKPVLIKWGNFDDEYLYFRLYTEQKLKSTEDSKQVYRLRKDDPAQIELIATLPQSVGDIYTVPGEDILFVEGYPNGKKLYVMKTDGSDLRELELP